MFYIFAAINFLLFPYQLFAADVVNNCDPEAEGLVLREEFCANPAKFICDENLNPHAIKPKQSALDFNSIYDDILHSREVQNELKANGLEGGIGCFSGDESNFNKCAQILEKAKEKKLYSFERKLKATRIFDKAKLMIKNYIDQRISYISPDQEDKIKALEALKDKVEGTNLYVGPLDPESASSFNAYFSKILPPSQQRWYHFIYEGYLKHTVVLEGMILLADESPGALLMAMLHEISHGIFPDNKDRPDFPFNNELQCLQRPDAANLKQNDLKCFTKILNRHKGDENSIFALKIQTTIDAIAEDKYSDLEIISLEEYAENGEIPCQISQINEGFSDWMATEAFAASSKLSGINSKAGLVSRDGKEYIDLLTSFSANREFGEWTSLFCDLYSDEKDSLSSHPKHATRLNYIQLIHPKIKFALGCRPSDVHNLKSLLNPVSQENRVYCGNNLNLR